MPDPLVRVKPLIVRSAAMTCHGKTVTPYVRGSERGMRLGLQVLLEAIPGWLACRLRSTD